MLAANPQVIISCEPSFIASEQQSLLAYAFQSTVSALILQPKQTIGDLDIFTVWDHQKIATWNRDMLKSLDSCIHWQFEDIAKRSPQAQAICSWDGDMNYGKLDQYSTALAMKLVDEGVGPEAVVALRFYKSLWSIVAMIAVLKAGGTFVSLDPTYPEERQKFITEDANAILALVSADVKRSESEWKLCKELVISETAIQDILKQYGDALTNTGNLAGPDNSAYIVYTSGSTGNPKGIIVEHKALCTSASEQAKAMQIDSKSRVLQFAAYTFDVSIGDIFTALTHGACLCIPSESSRKDNLAAAIESLQVTHACLTSTVAGILDPQDLLTLEVLTLGGESVSRHNVVKWANKVQLNNIYGPAECTVWCFIQRNVGTHDHEAKIGSGIGAKGWIVDPTNSDKLLPVGAIGELLVEGPLLARGYLNNSEKTSASFVSDPAWMCMFGPSTGRRLYKTGDLVRYDAADGTFIFIGRKDTQVKLRGQRIELGEIEYNLLRCMPTEKEAVVDLVKPLGSTEPVLAAFVSVCDGLQIRTDETASDAHIGDTKAGIFKGVKEAMAQFLPSYMIPALFVPVESIPRTTSGKTDRRKIRQFCSKLSWNALLQLSSEQKVECNGGIECSTESMAKNTSESQLAEAWSALLGIPAEDIKPSDSFISLGGDSLKAIHLVAAYRARNLSLSVADILQHPRLSALAARVTTIQPSTRHIQSETTDPESLAGMIPNKALRKKLLSEAAEQCSVDKDDLLGIYPCTPLQMEMMDLSLRGITPQFAHELVRLWPTLDLDKYKHAWEEVVRLHPILRTRFMKSSHDNKLRQVVIDEEVWWESPKDFDTYMSTNFAETLRPGERLVRWALYKERGEGPETPSGNQMLIISIHHSLFDGIALQRVFGDLYAAYQGQPLPSSSPSFPVYLRRMVEEKGLHDHGDYWSKYLAGWEAAGAFPSLPTPDHTPHASGGTARFYPFEGSAPHLGDLTLSTLLRGVWALYLARKTGSQMSMFSTFLAGRNIDMPGIEKLAAPTFGHVPILARLLPDQTVYDFLAQLQDEAVAMIPFEGTGMPAICEACGVEQLTRNLLVVQPMPGGGGRPPNMPGEDRVFPGDILCGPRVDPAAMGAFNPFPLLMECTMLDPGIAFRVSFDEKILSATAVEEMIDELIVLVKTLPNKYDQPLSSITLSAP
jgi:amino acid adenylation domain-containing protein